MSEANFPPLSPSVYCADTVYPFLNDSIECELWITPMIHNKIIHPWSTFFEHVEPCLKKQIAPSGATGTGSLESMTIPSTPSIFPIDYVNDIKTMTIASN